MKRGIVVLLALLGGAGVWATPRMVLGELFTSTTCPACPNAEASLDVVSKQDTAILAVIEYHMNWPAPGNDPFYHHNPTENEARRAYYGVSGIPTFRMDGKESNIAHSLVSSRSRVESPLSLELWNVYNDSTRKGTILAKIKNTGTSLHLKNSDTTVSGKIYFALTETGIHYTGRNGARIHNYTMLDMLPNASGKSLTLAPGDSLEETRTYTLEDSFSLNPPTNTTFHRVLPESCQIVAFVQNSTSREVLQAAKLWLTSTLGMALTFDNSSIVGGDNQLNPGETADLVLSIKNTGNKDLTGVEGTISTSDPYITVVDPQGNFGDIARNKTGDNQSDPFVVTADSLTPSGHSADFTLTVRSTNHFITEIPFTLTVQAGIGEQTRTLPAKLELGPAKPNPWRDWTLIRYALPTAMEVNLKIYSATGELVKTLAAKTEPAGEKQLLWDGRDANGSLVPSGVYFYELVTQSGEQIERITKKLMKVK